MCTENTFISKICIKDMEPLFIKVLWRNTEGFLFDIFIFFKQQCWSGNFLYDTARKNCDRLKESEEKYFQDVMNCLKHQDSMYKYDFSINSDDSASFCWKKMFEGSTAVFLHGSIDAHVDTINNKNSLIENLLSRNEMLLCSVENLKNENVKLNNGLEKCQTEFNKLIEVKSSLESTLYGKFVQLLNTKKRRIKILEDHLQMNNE